MTTPRKSRPAYLTRAEVEAMIAEAVAAERARSDRAMAGMLEAIRALSAEVDLAGAALGEAAETLVVHAGLLKPLSEAFAAGLDMVEIAHRAADLSSVN